MTNTSKAEIDTLLTEIRELKSRVDDLERAQLLTGNIPQGETITVLDPNDGSVLVTLGEADNGKLGLEVRNSAGTRVAHIGDLGVGATGIELGNNPGIGPTALLISEEGIRIPYLGHAWVKGDDFYSVTSGTFGPVMNCMVGLVSHQTVSTANITVTCGGATTAEVRVKCVPTGDVTSTVVCAAGVQTTMQLAWDCSAFLTLQTGPILFQIEARRASGASTVNVFTPGELFMGDNTPIVGGLA